jgi:hypothetical protein
MASTYRLSKEEGISGFLDFYKSPVLSKDDEILTKLNQTTGLEYLSKDTSTWLSNSTENPILMISEWGLEWKKNFYPT